MSKKIDSRPRYNAAADGELRNWAVQTALPWLTENLSLTAGAVCGSLPEAVRRGVYGGELPEPIDWAGNSIVISPPGTGKGMAIFVEALAHYRRVIVLVPSVVQAHKLEASLDHLYDSKLAGCQTSQRSSKGLIRIITTGIFHQMVEDRSSDIWKEGTVLIVDEAQRVLEDDPRTEFMVGYMAHMGLLVTVVSATISPGKLPEVFGHTGESARVYELTKQMHPVEIKTLSGDEPDELLKSLPELRRRGETLLVFAPSRREIARVVATIRKDDEFDVWAIPVTGAHMVEEQLTAVDRAQKSGKTVVVVATPGTMDSSVTIPGLSTVVIIDRRIRVDWNEYGVRERSSGTLPINHIWQMVRRVGREVRMDGGRDKVYIISSRSRLDVETEKPVFDPLTGCSPYTPIEDLLLEAARLDVRFADVHDYMLSTFGDEHIRAATARLLDHGMIRSVDDAADMDGFELTEKGTRTVGMPFGYKWNRLIVEAPRDLQMWLVMAASFGRLDDLQMFEDEFAVEANRHSEVIRKINLGVAYIGLVHDESQRIHAQGRDLSFRRMEQMESLFELGMEALGMEWRAEDLAEPKGDAERRLVEELVIGGLRVGLFDLWFPAKGGKGGWSEPRWTPDLPEGRSRRFFLDEGGLDLAGNAAGGIVAVVAEATWFTARGGMPLGNLDNATIVPKDLANRLVAERAEEEGWFVLTFEQGEHRGQPQMQAEWRGVTYVASMVDNEPEAGVAYWCSIDRSFGYSRKAVFVHYPAA